MRRLTLGLGRVHERAAHRVAPVVPAHDDVLHFQDCRRAGADDRGGHWGLAVSAPQAQRPHSALVAVPPSLGDTAPSHLAPRTQCTTARSCPGAWPGCPASAARLMGGRGKAWGTAGELLPPRAAPPPCCTRRATSQPTAAAPHVHKHLSRLQPDELVGRQPRIGAANPGAVERHRAGKLRVSCWGATQGRSSRRVCAGGGSDAPAPLNSPQHLDLLDAHQPAEVGGALLAGPGPGERGKSKGGGRGRRGQGRAVACGRRLAGAEQAAGECELVYNGRTRPCRSSHVTHWLA